MPILGIMASQISGHLWQPDGAYDSLATATVGSGGLATVTFASIPSTYKHLQIRLMGRGSSGGAENVLLKYNGSTTTYFALHQLYGDGSSAYATADSATGNNLTGYVSGATNTFGVAIIDILDYSNTSKYKVNRTLTGFDNNGSGFVLLRSGLWQNTAAITQIDLSLGSTTFQQYSSIALYGVK
jgi:hypothetical protein